MSATEYPHPVLQPSGSDYRNECLFDIVFDENQQRIEDSEIVLVVGYSLSCDGLEEMVKNGMAEACVITHSPATSYRRMHVIKSGKNAIEIRISKFDVVEKIELSCAIVAACNSRSFELNDFNPLFFEGMAFKVKKGALLAKTEKVTLFLDDTELEKPVTSIFNINRRDGQEVHIQPDFASDTGKIEINLCTKLYGLYSNIEQGYAKTFRRCLTGAIVLPVLVEAIGVLRADYEFYHEYRWARVIEKKLAHRGIDIQRDDTSSAELADELLGCVVEGSLEAFITVIEEESEWEDGAGGVD